MKTSPSSRSLALGIAAFVALGFANGEHANAAVAWIAPVLVLRFVRTRTGRAGLLAAWLGVAAAWAFAWHAVFRAEGAELAVAALLFGGVNLLPFLLDRALWRRLPPGAATLVFPCAWLAMEFGLAMVSPLGAWGMAAYTQADVTPVAQLAALAGMWGIGFLIMWTAAVANAVWAAPREREVWRAPALVLAAVWVAVVAVGTWRAAVPPSSPARLRVALLLPPVQDNLNYDDRLAPSIERHLHAATRRAARGGAQLVAWPEDSFFAPAGEGPGLRARLSALARREGVVLAAAHAAREQPGQLRYRNLSDLYSATGQSLWTYAKSHPVSGYESRHMTAGDGRIARARTPFGQVVGMICFDADHPAMQRQIRPDDDVLLVPSDDWPAIARLHPAMLRIRSIELGLAIVRPTINGRSVVFDARGRQWSAPPRASSDPWWVDVPLERLATPYARAPDAFAWASLVVLAILVAWAARRRRSPP